MRVDCDHRPLRSRKKTATAVRCRQVPSGAVRIQPPVLRPAFKGPLAYQWWFRPMRTYFQISARPIHQPVDRGAKGGGRMNRCEKTPRRLRADQVTSRAPRDAAASPPRRVVATKMHGFSPVPHPERDVKFAPISHKNDLPVLGKLREQSFQFWPPFGVDKNVILESQMPGDVARGRILKNIKVFENHRNKRSPKSLRITKLPRCMTRFYLFPVMLCDPAQREMVHLPNRQLPLHVHPTFDEGRVMNHMHTQVVGSQGDIWCCHVGNSVFPTHPCSCNS